MAMLSDFIPPGDDAVRLPTPTLAIHLLRYFIVASAAGHTPLFHPGNIVNVPSWAGHDLGSNPRGFLRAMAEAWAWLESESETGYPYFVTRRGQQLAKEVEPLRRLTDEARLAAGLHPLIEARIRQQFLLGEYELAAFAALRQVEIRVRELAGASESSLGVALMKEAFKADGPLADSSLDKGERDATMALFWGAIGVFKNPTSHRQVDYKDRTQAAEVILLADLLLRMLDDIAERLKSANT
ncbi:MAG: TIGR02391 family protein [Nitrospirae bacterium]|nr:MAG: TIGR02391 family protein [Nitrospirota bacterium]